MKSTITKTTVALAIGLVAATSAVRADSFFERVKNGTMNAAADTWDGSKAVARSIVRAPQTAYQVARGDRPLFLHREVPGREQMALTGHRTAEQHYREESAARHNEPPPI